MTTLSTFEKVSYGAGDAAANLVWRGALAYMAVFYTDTFGLAPAAAALLFLVVRLSDGITDIVMGMIADRTNTKMGKYRPWILWSAPFLGVFMVLCFTTPDLSDTGKLIYAYATYIGLTLAYTVSNVPYSALMGVMTDNPSERTSLSGYRFAGAFLGGMFVMGFLPSFVQFLGEGDSAKGYQYTFYVYALMLVGMMLLTAFFTKERVSSGTAESGSLRQEISDLSRQIPWLVMPLAAITAFFYFRTLTTGVILFFVLVAVYLAIRALKKNNASHQSRSQQDLVDLLENKPWLILLCLGFLTMMFNGVKYAAIPYYFKYYVGDELLAGQYFIALLVISVVGALLTPKLSERFGRRGLFILSLVSGSVLTAMIFWVSPEDILLLFILGISSEFFAAIIPTLFFSMLGDTADYSEWKTGRRATGLVYSAGTFVQKTGGGFAGALVLLVLAHYGYDGADKSSVDSALGGMALLMSFIPALFCIAGAAIMCFYPLTDDNQRHIHQELCERRVTEANSV